MKRIYHLCLSAENEIMFRCAEDFIRGINCLCLANYKTNSSLLAYVFMSNHVHICIRTEDLTKFIRIFRYSYTRYFNAKYKRHGRLGEKDFFVLEIEGLHHLLTAIAYILRNPMHHGVTGTPFGYPYSSIRAIFREDFGWENNCEYLSGQHEYHHIPSHHILPPTFKMNALGMILPESSIDFKDVEHQFSTARTFLYYMNRLSGDKWEKEQLQDGVSNPPITLENMERGICLQEVKTMLANEHGRANYNTIKDVQLCYEIDNVILPRYGKDSIYSLSYNEKKRLAQSLVREYRAPVSQICRCLAIESF